MGFSLLNYDSSVDAHHLVNVRVYWALNSIVNRIIDQLQTAGDSSSKNKAMVQEGIPSIPIISIIVGL